MPYPDGDRTGLPASLQTKIAAIDSNADGSLSPADHVPGQAHDDSVTLVGVLLHQLDVQGWAGEVLSVRRAPHRRCRRPSAEASRRAGR